MQELTAWHDNTGQDQFSNTCTTSATNCGPFKSSSLLKVVHQNALHRVEIFLRPCLCSLLLYGVPPDLPLHQQLDLSNHNQHLCWGASTQRHGVSIGHPAVCEPTSEPHSPSRDWIQASIWFYCGEHWSQQLNISLGRSDFTEPKLEISKGGGKTLDTWLYKILSNQQVCWKHHRDKGTRKARAGKDQFPTKLPQA